MNRQILVIDDEDGARTLIGIMVERGGFEALKARDAYEALDILKEATPALIILDVMMPGMNGIQLCRNLRSMPATQSIPILILSARGDPESVADGMEAGANDYLSKPVLFHDLMGKIRELLHLDSA